MDHITGDYVAQRRIRCVHRLCHVRRYGDFCRHLAQLQNDPQVRNLCDVDLHAIQDRAPKAGLFYFHFVGSGRHQRKRNAAILPCFLA